LEERGILQRESSGGSSKKKMGSRKSSANPDRIEKRKSSVFGRSKSTKMNLDVIQLESVIGKTVILL
jgi:hypothetical protein